MTVRWLSDDELDAWRPLAALLVLLPARLDDAVQPFGLTFFEYSALAVLAQAPGAALPTSELAGMSNGSLSRMSHLARRLERRGIVQRVTDPDDRRITLVTLTDDGRALLESAAPAHVAAVRALVIDTLEPQQLAALGDASSHLVESLHPTPPKPQQSNR